MNGRHRNYSQLSYLLIVAMVIVVGVYFENRSVDVASHGRRMEMLLQLRQLDTQLDRDVLRVSSFQLTNYDSLVSTARELRDLARVMRAAGGDFVGVTNEEVEQALGAAVESIELKRDHLERIKSQVALIRNGLEYLPRAVDEFSQQQPLLGNRMARLLNRFYLHSLVPGEIDIARLRRELGAIRRDAGDAADSALFRSILFHMEGHLVQMAELSQLRERYDAEPTRARFDELFQAYNHYFNERSRNSQWVSAALLSATVVLFALLGLALHGLSRAHLETAGAWRKLRDAVESLSEAFALFDANGRLVLFNSRYLAFYPWLRGHLEAGRPMAEICRANRDSGRLLVTEGKGCGEGPLEPVSEPRSYLQQVADGRWYLASDTPTSEGGMACVRVDVTESKRRELQLRKLSGALEQSPVSVIVTDITGTIEYVNPKFQEITGYTAAEAIGRNPRMLKSGHLSTADYRELWNTINAGREWRGTFLNKRKDGSHFWESASISPLRDDDGRITHFVAVKEDITQRKRAEDKLRLHATVFDTTTEGIIVTDANNRIKTVNPAFSRITGYNSDEVVGRDPKLLSSGRHDREFYRQMWSALSSSGHWSGEVWNRRKDGSLYPEWLSVVAIVDESGKNHEYIGVFSDITQRKQDEAQIRRQANYDALTNLPNRTLLFDRLSQALALARRDGGKVALLFIDLDHFKGINDGLGHVVGDEMLRLVAERLRACLRQSDTVARFGGDEFVIVLESIADVAPVAALAEKVIRLLSEPFHLAGRELFIGASAGITLFPDDSQDPDTLLRNADMAMYQAKEGGRNRFQFFTQEMNRRTEARLEMERGLRRALEREQFVLEYQPIFELRSGRMVKVEVLLRWRHPELGLVRPEHFVPLAEESGLISPIGLWVLRTASQQVSAWRKKPGMTDLKLAVNLSSRQWQLGLDVATIARILEATHLPPDALVLEITEGMVLEGTEEVIAWLHQIRALGVELAVDDFGTGYSSLSYLKRFPVGELKIDYSFVRDLPGDENSASLVRAILSMGRNLGLKVVAEGVERPEQLAFFQQSHCDYVQGFLLSGPRRPEEIPEFASGLRIGELPMVV